MSPEARDAAATDHRTTLAEYAAKQRCDTAVTLSKQLGSMQRSLVIFIGVLACLFMAALSYHAATLHPHITATCEAQP